MCWEECGKICDTAGKGCSSQKPKVITEKKRGLAAFCEARIRTDMLLLVPREHSLLSIGGLEDSKYNKSFNGGLVKGGGTLWISRTSGTKPWMLLAEDCCESHGTPFARRDTHAQLQGHKLKKKRGGGGHTPTLADMYRKHRDTN